MPLYEVWKYPLVSNRALIADRVDLEMPRNAKALTVQLQNGIPTLWARVNPPSMNETRTVYIEPTGAELRDPEAEYVGTMQFPNGLVFHAFIR